MAHPLGDFDGTLNPELERQEAREDWWHALQLLGGVALIVAGGILAFLLFTWSVLASVAWLRAHL